MADTGWRSPTATGGTDNGWTDSANAYSSNDEYATANLGVYGEAKQSYETFGLGVPDGATIDGIEVSVEWYLSNESGIFRVQIYNTTLGGYTYKNVTDRTNEGTDVVGGSSDEWAYPGNWAPSDFSDANFHCQLWAQGGSSGSNFYVDHLQVKVYYTPKISPLPTHFNI